MRTKTILEAYIQAREALEQVEEVNGWCPWCGEAIIGLADGIPFSGGLHHAPDCKRQLALGISNVTEQ